MVPTTEADRRRLLVGVLLPPLLWLFQFTLDYALVPWACAGGHRAVLVLVHLLALAGVMAAGLLAWRGWRDRSHQPLTADLSGVDGAHFLATMAVASSVLFSMVILAQVVATLMLRPCD